jgi:hypothetical protein
MLPLVTRRDFVARTLQLGTLAGAGDLAFLAALPPVAAADSAVAPAMVRLSPDIEPLVELIEKTPRDRLLKVVGERVRQGLAYQPLFAALLLAGVRGIKPRPVGFKFHAVLVVNSAHLAALDAPDRDRWLPLFWALDNFKRSQATNQAEGGWVMPPVAESTLPPSHQARQRFIAAMDNWDEEAADRAVTALTRTAGAGEIIELLWRYGARDFRDIGHKAIYVANSWRALQTIGWRHAEPVLRSLAFALLEHEGSNPAMRDAEADRPGRDNVKRSAAIRVDWQRGVVNTRATSDLLAALRTATPAEAADQVVTLLNQKVDPASLWDGLFLTAGELLMRQPGIIGIHCVTATNALHFGYQASGQDDTRRWLLLQAAAFLALFRQFMVGRGPLGDARIDTLERMDPTAAGQAAIEEILTDVSKDRLTAARKTLALVEKGSIDPRNLMTAARRLIFNKGTDSHDYKFSSAALEDYYHATPSWRGRYLAASMFNLRGSQDRDNDLVQRTREALGA